MILWHGSFVALLFRPPSLPPVDGCSGQMLGDLENKGRAMVGMAGRLSDLLPPSFVADLSRLEANIVN